MKLVEWNIHKMKSEVPAPGFVGTRLKSTEADILCLTEYTHDEGIRNDLKNDYYLEESIPLSGNQILIAIKKELAPTGVRVVCNIEEKQCYNFLHISFLPPCMEAPLSVIGIRMLTGKGKNAMDATKQTPSLVRYLSKLNTPFFCVGDFNIRRERMGCWFPGFHIGDIVEKGDDLNNYSYIYSKELTISDFGVLDHILVSSDFKARVEYDWGFTDDNMMYPPRDNIKIGELWDVEVAYPDHAIMVAEISLNLPSKSQES